MGKIILFIFIFLTFLKSNSNINIKQNCLLCHLDKKIDNSKIYRRYLMFYSSKTKVKKAMFNYLKKPDINSSVLPRNFFKIHKTKKKSKLTNKELKENIQEYIKIYDIQKKLK